LAEGVLSLGSDGGGERRLSGALDELRISDDAAYRQDFLPPGSFAGAAAVAQP
jgi:hypothetical protein